MRYTKGKVATTKYSLFVSIVEYTKNLSHRSEAEKLDGWVSVSAPCSVIKIVSCGFVLTSTCDFNVRFVHVSMYLFSCSICA